MESAITEDVFLCNLVRNVFSLYERNLCDEITKFYNKYDPRKSLNKDFIVRLFDVLFWNLNDVVTEVKCENNCDGMEEN